MPSITIRPPDDQHLPTANTCISRLYVPLYSSKQILKQKLLLAIKTKNFGFVQKFNKEEFKKGKEEKHVYCCVIFTQLHFCRFIFCLNDFMKFDILSPSPRAVICLCCEHKQLVIFISVLIVYFSFVLMKKRYTVQNIPALAL